MKGTILLTNSWTLKSAKLAIQIIQQQIDEIESERKLKRRVRDHKRKR
jgi:hypothetical protein